MADVKAGVEYKINVNNNLFLLDNKKYQLLQSILDYGSLTKAAKEIKVSYRTALNYIEKMGVSVRKSKHLKKNNIYRKEKNIYYKIVS